MANDNVNELFGREIYNKHPNTRPHMAQPGQFTHYGVTGEKPHPTPTQKPAQKPTKTMRDVPENDMLWADYIKLPTGYEDMGEDDLYNEYSRLQGMKALSPEDFASLRAAVQELNKRYAETPEPKYPYKPRERFDDQPYHVPQRDLSEYSYDELLGLMDSYDYYTLADALDEVPEMNDEQRAWYEKILAELENRK